MSGIQQWFIIRKCIMKIHHIKRPTEKYNIISPDAKKAFDRKILPQHGKNLNSKYMPASRLIVNLQNHSYESQGQY